MTEEAFLETSPKNNMIQDMINSDNMNSTESTILNIFLTKDSFDKDLLNKNLKLELSELQEKYINTSEELRK